MENPALFLTGDRERNFRATGNAFFFFFKKKKPLSVLAPSRHSPRPLPPDWPLCRLVPPELLTERPLPDRGSPPPRIAPSWLLQPGAAGWQAPGLQPPGGRFPLIGPLQGFRELPSLSRWFARVDRFLERDMMVIVYL